MNPSVRWHSLVPAVHSSSEDPPPFDYFHPLKVSVTNTENVTLSTLCREMFVHNIHSISLELGHIKRENRSILINYINDLLNFFRIKSKLECARLVVLKESTPGNWGIEDADIDDDILLHRYIDSLETGQEYYGYEVVYNNKPFFLFREFSNTERYGILDPTTHTIIEIHQTDKTGFVFDEEDGRKRIAVLPTGDTNIHFFDFVKVPLLRSEQDIVIEATNSLTNEFEEEDVGVQISSAVFVSVADRETNEVDEPIILPESGLAPSHVYSPVVQNDKYVISAVNSDAIFHMSDWDAWKLS